MMRFGLLLGALVLLSACSEKPQTGTARKVDSRAYEGAVPAYTAQGWKAGDETSWEQQLKKRAQHQNEYGRMAP